MPELKSTEQAELKAAAVRLRRSCQRAPLFAAV
jgi:hypothetical protein